MGKLQVAHINIKGIPATLKALIFRTCCISLQYILKLILVKEFLSVVNEEKFILRLNSDNVSRLSRHMRPCLPQMFCRTSPEKKQTPCLSNSEN